jgi:nitroimidazol reductase NimA-like FMN-containing flavoprotein (pyridoxamine 5'-phosphate oxidase superfamily)
MVEYTGAWDREAVADFLADATIPVRLACRTPSGRLWQVTLWFVHRDGRIACATSADADVVRFIREHPGVAFDISTNEMPYRGVRGYGTTTIEPDPGKELLADLVERYLGGTDSELADTLLDEGRDEVRVLVEPDRVHSWDYSDRMADVGE